MLSASLQRRLAMETVRAAGSMAVLIYYDGPMPERCEEAAKGERVGIHPANEGLVRGLSGGVEPKLLEGAAYWRLLDNGGLVVMQGDGT